MVVKGGGDRDAGGAIAPATPREATVVTAQPPTALRPTTSVNRTILLLAFASFTTAASMRITDPLLVPIAKDLESTVGAVSLSVTIFALGFGLGQVFHGIAGDRYGKLRLITFGLLGGALCNCLSALALSVELLVLARLLAGLLLAGILPLAIAWVGDAVPYEQRQIVLSRFIIGQLLGMSFGQIVSGALAEFLSWRTAFLGFGLLQLATWPPLLYERYRVEGGARAAAAVPEPVSQQWRRLMGAARRPLSQFVLPAVFLEGIFVFGALAFAATHLMERFGLGAHQAAFAGGAYALGGILYGLMGGPAIRRLHERSRFLAGTFATAVAGLAFAFAPDAWIGAGSLVLLGAGYYLCHNALQTRATQMMPEARGAALALFLLVFYIGQAIGVGLAGCFVDSHGIATIFIASALGQLGLGLALYLGDVPNVRRD